MVTLDKHIWQIAPVDGDQGRSTQIISSMLEMAQSLHLPVVVEGVETNEQANMLRQEQFVGVMNSIDKYIASQQAVLDRCCKARAGLQQQLFI